MQIICKLGNSLKYLNCYKAEKGAFTGDIRSVYIYANYMQIRQFIEVFELLQGGERCLHWGHQVSICKYMLIICKLGNSVKYLNCYKAEKGAFTGDIRSVYANYMQITCKLGNSLKYLNCYKSLHRRHQVSICKLYANYIQIGHFIEVFKLLQEPSQATSGQYMLI